MLLWGSNGVEKDIRAAVMWYARSALQMDDPTAMYDYAILLLKVIHRLHVNLSSRIFSNICNVKRTHMFVLYKYKLPTHD